MELANTPFRTLRALRLVAEVYAIKGLNKQDSEDSLPISLVHRLIVFIQVFVWRHWKITTKTATR